MIGRSDYLRRLAVLGVVSGLCSWFAASVMHGIQHQRWGQAYLLVPVNSFWLYFIPIAFSGAVWVSFKAGRLNAGLGVGAVLAWFWAGGRLTYWTWIAGQLVGRPGVEEFSVAVRQHALPPLAVGATGLLAFCVFGLGAIESVRRTTDANERLEGAAAPLRE